MTAPVYVWEREGLGGVVRGGVEGVREGKIGSDPLWAYKVASIRGIDDKNVKSLVEKSQGKIREMRNCYRIIDVEIDIVLLAPCWVRGQMRPAGTDTRRNTA